MRVGYHCENSKNFPPSGGGKGRDKQKPKTYLHKISDKPNIFVGQNSDGTGAGIQINNKHGEIVSIIGTDKQMDGIIILSDRYGDPGWAQTGKQ